MTDVANKPQVPKQNRYDGLNLQVSTLNQQIEELVAHNEQLEGDIEVFEKQIRETRRMIARNDKAADKLRRKRDVVSRSAYEVFTIDQP